MPIYGYISSGDLLVEAEQLVTGEINRLLAQSSGDAPIQVAVLGDRNGEIIPILTTEVSRQQWRQNPQLRAWTRYHDAYALLRRHDQELVALAPASGSRPNHSSSSQRSLGRVEAAADAGTLSGEMAQEYASDLD